MKYLVLGLFSLALLGFVGAQSSNTPLTQGTTSMPYSGTTNTTGPYNNTATGSNPTGSSPTGSNPTSSNPTGSNTTGSKPTGSEPTGSKPGSNPTSSNPTGDTPTGSTPTGNNPISSQRPTATPMSVTQPGKTTKNGQSHIFTSVSLLLGSFVLHALWQ